MEKEHATYTLNKGNKQRFDTLCKKHNYNKAGVVDSLIEIWLNDKQKQGQV